MWRIAADVNPWAPELIAYEGRDGCGVCIQCDCPGINRLRHGISHARIRGKKAQSIRQAQQIEGGEPNKRPAHAAPRTDI